MTRHKWIVLFVAAGLAGTKDDITREVALPGP